MHRSLTRTVAMTASSILALAGFVGLSSVPASAAEATAGALLDGLAVVPENTSAYSRDYFEHWIDADGDGCDTRQEVLILESTAPVSPQGQCPVTSGSWNSWYDGAVWTAPSDVDIDHMVPLSEAWDSGAYAWTPGQRRDFANDLGLPESLEAVTDEVNASKSDRDPAEWLPALDQCRYAVAWVKVKFRWSLSIDTTERDSLGGLLSGTCGTTTVTVPAIAITTAPTPDPPAPVRTSQLAKGQMLAAGALLTSPNGRYRAVMQGDGNFVVYAPDKVLWHSRTNGNGGARTILQGDGNLVLYSSGGQPLWHTGTNGKDGTRLLMQDDGNLVLYNSTHRPLWASGPDRVTPPPPPPPPPPSGNTLKAGQALAGGQSLRSANGRYRVVMQGDGNTVVYSPTRALWSSRTNGNGGARLVMQGDGNVVIYATTGHVLFNTRTNGYGGARLVIQDDGNLVAYYGNRPLWNTGPERAATPPQPQPPQPQPGNCDRASYPDFCIPPSPPDLDCPEVRLLPGFRPGFTVLAPDPHRLDGPDNDRRGCE